MKKTIYKLLIIIFPFVFLFSCNRDDFSEKDALDAQQKVDLSITVVDGTSSQAPVEGALVILHIDSTFVSRTTNSIGSVVFNNVKIGGEVIVSVEKDQYTSILTPITIDPQSYRQTQVSELLYIYSFAAGKTATIKGRLTMQSDLTDRDREVAANVVVTAKNGNLTTISNQLFTATTDANGFYSVSVPVSGQGDQIMLYYPEFTVNQKLALEQSDMSRAIVERPVLYRPCSSPTFDIPCVPSVYPTVAPPSSTAGSNFDLGSKPNRIALTSSSSYYLAEGGSGYSGGATISDYQLSFTPDPDGVSAKLQVDIVNGKITHIDYFVDNGARYSSAPTLNVNDLSPTTPATILFNFQTTYKIFITNKGTNYSIFPTVAVETEYINSSLGTKVKSVDSDIDDNANASLGVNFALSNYAHLYNGSIRSNANGDTLILATAAFSTAPVFNVINPTPKRAILYAYTSGIYNDSTLLMVDVRSGGLGYSQGNPPEVTLNTLAGYGKEAVAKAIVSSTGRVSDIIITNPGKGYVRNVNDYRKNGCVTNTYDNPSCPNTYYGGIKPGDIIVQDVYYGTGYQILNQNTGKK
jgi:hypothetical protein